MADTNTLEKVIAVVRETLDIDEDTDLEQEFDMTFEVENLDQIVTIGDAADAIDEA